MFCGRDKLLRTASFRQRAVIFYECLSEMETLLHYWQGLTYGQHCLDLRGKKCHCAHYSTITGAGVCLRYTVWHSNSLHRSDLLAEMRIIADVVLRTIWPGAFISLDLVFFILALPLTGHVTLCILSNASDSQLCYIHQFLLPQKR